MEHQNKLQNVRSIADAPKKKVWQVVEEVYCIAKEGSNRWLGILVYNDETTAGTIIYPTIRFESSKNQSEEVNIENKNIHS